MLGRLRINVKRARIVTESMPSIERYVGLDRRSVHGNPVCQETKHGKSRQEAGSDRSIGLFVPPRLRDLVGCVTLNQQGEEDVSVRDTRHSSA